jgi:hypothetical protein
MSRPSAPRTLGRWPGGPPDGSNIHTHVRVTFDPENGKTRIRIVQRGFPSPDLRDSFASGWGRILEGLARVVDARVAG